VIGAHFKLRGEAARGFALGGKYGDKYTAFDDKSGLIGDIIKARFYAGFDLQISAIIVAVRNPRGGRRFLAPALASVAPRVIIHTSVQFEAGKKDFRWL
jgi:hypothetical protein